MAAVRFFRKWRAKRAERRSHNDRDYECKYWWGDRGGYVMALEKCRICNPIYLLSPGEFWVSPEVARVYGMETLRKINEGTL